MEHKWIKPGKLTQWLSRYKYVLLVLLIGVGLLLWPSSSEKESEPAPQAETGQSQDQSQELLEMQQRLEQVLSQIDGAGEVRVMLTLKTGTEYLYQTDQTDDHSAGETEQNSQSTETVLASDGSSQQKPLIRQTICPTYQGALVVSQGADSAEVKLHLVNAVASLTGLPTDQITVVKMKTN